MRKLQQTLRTAKAVDGLVLLSHLPPAFSLQGIKEFSCHRKVAGKECILYLRRQPSLNACLNIFFPIPKALPHAPELPRRTCCGIHSSILVYCHNKLHIWEKPGDIFILLIADSLFYSLTYFLLRRFALNHGKRDTIHKEHNIGSGSLIAPGALDTILRRNMKNIILPIPPVYIAQGETLGVAFNRLFQRCPQSEEIIDRLIGLLLSIPLHILQLLNGGLNVFLTE